MLVCTRRGFLGEKTRRPKSPLRLFYLWVFRVACIPSFHALICWRESAEVLVGLGRWLLTIPGGGSTGSKGCVADSDPAPLHSPLGLGCAFAPRVLPLPLLVSGSLASGSRSRLGSG